MNFRAKLKHNSSIYRLWIGASRVGGSISGVQFKRIGRDFVSAEDPLSGEAVSSMLRHEAIELETSTAPVGNLEVVQVAEDDPPADDPPPSDDPPNPNTDPMAALWRRRDPPQDPVMRKRGRPPGPR